MKTGVIVRRKGDGWGGVEWEKGVIWLCDGAGVVGDRGMHGGMKLFHRTVNEQHI